MVAETTFDGSMDVNVPEVVAETLRAAGVEFTEVEQPLDCGCPPPTPEPPEPVPSFRHQYHQPLEPSVFGRAVANNPDWD
jgi:hypothetical protein